MRPRPNALTSTVEPPAPRLLEQWRAAQVEGFLSDLAVQRHMSASMQAQASAALPFLGKEVLRIELPGLSEVVIARPSPRLPGKLTPGEGPRCSQPARCPARYAA